MIYEVHMLSDNAGTHDEFSVRMSVEEIPLAYWPMQYRFSCPSELNALLKDVSMAWTRITTQMHLFINKYAYMNTFRWLLR